MIAYLEGELLRSETNLLVIKTSGGVGYAVHVPLPLAVAVSADEFITLHIYTNVREDDLSLYGFRTLGEKQLFEMLIRTSGVGPKLGLAILSALSPRRLADAVHQGNVGNFSQVPGIGKKTATKLCLDMKDQLKKHPVSGLESEFGETSGSETVSPASETDEVFSALKNIGYSEKEILAVFREIGTADLSFETKFKKALSLLTPLR